MPGRSRWPDVTAPRGTSHVSVVDGAGNAAAMTSSTGCGSGVFAGSTGLHLNNMLGEEDLTGHGQPRPGERLTSMMSPTIAEGPDGSVLVAGSSGSARIRSAMHRVLGALIEHGLEPREAVDLPRIHVTPAGLDCEYGFPGRDVARARAAGRARHLVAGSQHLLRRCAGGDAARRPVRGGGRPAPRRRRGGGAGVTAAIRPVVPGDAAALSALYRAQRDFLAPFEPVRAESFFTEVTQRVRLTEIAERRRMGAGYSWLILDEGVVAGMISLSNVIRGPFQSANIGYFVAREHNGRGLATSAVEQVVDEAFSTVGLHRVEAGTLLDNVGSQRVLKKAGFEQFGLARRYLHIGGEWRDHVLFQRLSDS